MNKDFVSVETLIARWRTRLSSSLAALSARWQKRVDLIEPDKTISTGRGEVRRCIRELDALLAALPEPVVSAPPAQAPTDEEAENTSRVDGVPGVGHGDLPRNPQRDR